ncbi:MAG: VCBS repeat-containing protein [Planctomycetes bacterium]|nr:VCBS repeat-containing protein [Planctomycetota bacterium]
MHTYVQSIVSRTLFATCVVTVLGSVPAQTRMLFQADLPLGNVWTYTPRHAGDVDRDGVPDLVMLSLDSTTSFVRVTSGRTGLTYRQWNSAIRWFSVDTAGDLNQDGHDDILLGGAGEVRVCSGKDGTTILSVKDPNKGFALVRGGKDLDGDGKPDILVAYPELEDFTSRVDGLSGSNGKLLYSLRADVRTWFGSSMAMLRDIDRDGKADFVVGVPFTRGGGEIIVYSGASGKRLYTAAGNGPPEFGVSVDQVDDVDGDGIVDIIVGAAGTNGPCTSGYARVLSGKNGALIREIRSPRANVSDRFGNTVAGVGDLNADGVPDFGVGAPCSATSIGVDVGTAYFFSGKDGSLLWSVDGNRANQFFGAMAGIGDVNEDGVADVAIGHSLNPSSGRAAGLYSGREVQLTESAYSIPASSGGSIDFRFDAGVQNVWKLYVCLGSASGRLPGLALEGAHVPLNLDGYFGLLLSAPNTLVQPSVGLIGPNGIVSTKFVLPAGLGRGLIGRSLHHCFVVFDRTFGVVSSSNSVPITIVQ